MNEATDDAGPGMRQLAVADDMSGIGRILGTYSAPTSATPQIPPRRVSEIGGVTQAMEQVFTGLNFPTFRLRCRLCGSQSVLASVNRDVSKPRDHFRLKPTTSFRSV